MRFNNAENEAITLGRQDNPTYPQRALANAIWEGRFGRYSALMNRTESSIYGAVRRMDRSKKADTRNDSKVRRRMTAA